MFAYISLAFVGLIWGSTFIIVKDSLNSIGPFTLLTLRFIVASLVLYIIIKIKNLNIKDNWKWGLISGVAQFCTYVPQVIGLMYTTPINSAFITVAYIIFIPLAHVLLLKKIPRNIEFLSVAVAIAGL